MPCAEHPRFSFPFGNTLHKSRDEKKSNTCRTTLPVGNATRCSTRIVIEPGAAAAPPGSTHETPRERIDTNPCKAGAAEASALGRCDADKAKACKRRPPPQQRRGP